MRLTHLILLLCTVYPSFAHATADETYEQEMAHTHQVESPAQFDEVNPGVRQLSFDGPIALSKSTDFPYGFQQKDIAPPFRLGIKLEPTLSKRSNVGMWFNANMGFLPTNIAPIMDAAFGFKIKLERWYVLFGAQFTDQTLPHNGAINQSQFDTTYFALLGGFGYHDAHWDTRLNLKTVFYHDTPIASDEGIETDVAHDATIIEGITVTYTSGFGLKGWAGVDEYDFGKTGVVSKEFALGFDTHSETRFRLGASYQIAPFEIRAESRFTAGVGDQIENSYCAIFLNDDYVLSPVVLYLGVAWNF